MGEAQDFGRINIIATVNAASTKRGHYFTAIKVFSSILKELKHSSCSIDPDYYIAGEVQIIVVVVVNPDYCYYFIPNLQQPRQHVTSLSYDCSPLILDYIII